MLRSLVRILRGQNLTSKYGIPQPAAKDLAFEPLSGELRDLSAINGVPDEELEDRLARIYKPSPSTMQSGTQKYQTWRIEFSPKQDEHWANPLTGWVSSNDALEMVILEFSTKDEAVAYAKRNGWKYEVTEPQEAPIVGKSYADNFKYHPQTRKPWLDILEGKTPLHGAEAAQAAKQAIQREREGTSGEQPRGDAKRGKGPTTGHSATQSQSQPSAAAGRAAAATGKQQTQSRQPAESEGQQLKAAEQPQRDGKTQPSSAEQQQSRRSGSRVEQFQKLQSDMQQIDSARAVKNLFQPSAAAAPSQETPQHGGGLGVGSGGFVDSHIISQPQLPKEPVRKAHASGSKQPSATEKNEADAETELKSAEFFRNLPSEGSAVRDDQPNYKMRSTRAPEDIAAHPRGAGAPKQPPAGGLGYGPHADADRGVRGAKGAYTGPGAGAKAGGSAEGLRAQGASRPATADEALGVIAENSVGRPPTTAQSPPGPATAEGRSIQYRESHIPLSERATAQYASEEQDDRLTMNRNESGEETGHFKSDTNPHSGPKVKL